MDRQQRQLCRRTRLDMSKGERMKEWVSVLKATDAAARWHVHQRRKGSAQEPYVNHLLEVADMVAHALSGMMNVTMSAGVSEVRREDSAEDILARADAALYRAKDAGRNQVIAA
jgi:GGDEF domain-containing protein